MSLAVPYAVNPVNLLVDFSSSVTRAVFQIYLSVVFFTIGLVGAKCCENRVKLDLVRGNTVHLSHMVSWMTNLDLVKAIFKLRALPAGWLGLVMIATSALFIADTLVVAILIKDKTVQTRCKFGTGMVVSTNDPTPSSSYFQLVVPYNGAPATVAAQAQTISLGNGGLRGVYKKVNRQLTFSAQPQDLVGNWNCAPFADELVFPHDYPLEALKLKLFSLGLLYNYSGEMPACYSLRETVNLNKTSHIVIWDTSVGTQPYVPFDVRVSVDLTQNSTDNIVMKSFQCTATGQIPDILRSIYGQNSLTNWCETLQGAIYNGGDTPASPGVQNIIEETLNTLTMVAGGHNYLLNTTAAGQTQGCVGTQTNINWAVIVLAVVTTLVLIAAVIYWIVLRILIKKALKVSQSPSQPGGATAAQQATAINKTIEMYTPSDVFEWMVHTAQVNKGRHGTQTDVKLSELKIYRYGRKNDIPEMGLL